MAESLTCPSCGLGMFFTGEMHPTIVPQRYYACVNRHIVLRYDDHTPDWGDHTVTNMWRAAFLDRTDRNDNWEMLGAYGNHRS